MIVIWSWAPVEAPLEPGKLDEEEGFESLGGAVADTLHSPRSMGRSTTVGLCCAPAWRLNRP